MDAMFDGWIRWMKERRNKKKNIQEAFGNLKDILQPFSIEFTFIFFIKQPKQKETNTKVLHMYSLSKLRILRSSLKLPAERMPSLPASRRMLILSSSRSDVLATFTPLL